MTSRVEAGDHLKQRLKPETRVVLTRDINARPIPFGRHQRGNVLWEDGAGVWVVVDGHMYGECIPRDAVAVVIETPEEAQRRMDKQAFMRRAREWYEAHTERMITADVYRALWYYERGVMTWDEVGAIVGRSMDYAAFWRVVGRAR